MQGYDALSGGADRHPRLAAAASLSSPRGISLCGGSRRRWSLFAIGRFTTMKRTFLLPLAALLCLPLGLLAQVETARIIGTIKDAAGALVPGARITITN